jgi:hypothetical protein
VTSKETRFVTLELKNEGGDLIGSLWSPSFDQPVEVHATPGWRYSTLEISELRGKFIFPVATVQVRITENDNRLRWVVTSPNRPTYLPPYSLLWPYEQDTK